MLNAHEGDIVAENTILYSVEYVVLSEILGRDSSEMQENIIKYIELMRNHKTNRFNNIPGVTEGPDKYISHDQYTSLCAFSAYFGLDYHKEFWKGVKFGTYDNITGKFNIKRMLHPRDLIYIGYLNDNKICKLLMPLLCLITIQSFGSVYKVRPTFWNWMLSGFKGERRKMVKTEGELIGLVRDFGLKEKSWLFNWTWEICMALMELKFEEGYKSVFRKFFHLAPQHPNIQLADQLTTIHDI